MFDDLLGDFDEIDAPPAPPKRIRQPDPYIIKRPRGRPRKDLLNVPTGNIAESAGAVSVMADVMSGVSMKFLSQVFKVDQKIVSNACRGIRPVRSAGGNMLYAVHDVAPYLVAPKMSVEEYLEKIDPKHLPEHLRETYWNVQAKSQKVRLAAGDLWLTEDVIEVLGEMFKHIKNTIMLWADTVEEETGTLTDEQRNVIVALADALQQEIHQTVVHRASETQTRNQAKEFDTVPEVEDDYGDI